jgi:hypothetical protein
MYIPTNKQKSPLLNIEGFWSSGGPPYTLRKISHRVDTPQKQPKIKHFLNYISRDNSYAHSIQISDTRIRRGKWMRTRPKRTSQIPKKIPTP